MVRETFQLEGLHCPSCVARIERAVSGLPGVHEARLAFATGHLTVAYDPGRLGSDAILRKVRALGYPGRSIRVEREEG